MSGCRRQDGGGSFSGRFLMQEQLPGMPLRPLEVLHVELTWTVMGRISISVCARRHGQPNWGRASCVDLPPSADDELLTAIDGCVRTALRRSSIACQDR